MILNKKQARTLQSAIDLWVRRHVITHDLGEMLSDTYTVARFDWRRLSRYSFWIAIICIIVAAGAVISDDYLMDLMTRLLKAPAMAKSLFMALIAVLFYAYGVRRKRKDPTKQFSNEAIFFLGVLATATAVTFLGEALDTGSGHFSMLLLLAALIYGALGLWFPSKMVWVFALLSLGGWIGAETGYASGWGAYYLGMNFPLRFVLFGGVLIAAGTALPKWTARADFSRPTLAMGFLYLFIALWIMSIFGNYGDLHVWREARRLALLHWSLTFGVAAGAAIYFGIRMDDGMARGFGITFLFINLYTRFFEYFWDSLHKALFFALLGASFWYIGLRAEKIWRRNETPLKKPSGCA
jgi:hypothetical protein